MLLGYQQVISPRGTGTGKIIYFKATNKVISCALQHNAV
ncbi:MAG: hypothetical protein ACI945_000213 [Pseudohongiellaceae bacterium]|jgi:hypothetical protein